MVEATKLSADKMLQALARDFIIYVEEDCFAHQDLLENFVNAATVYLKKYNKQLLVNTDYMTNARKLIADEKNLRLSLSMLEKMPNFRKVSGKNYEDLTNELRESGDTLFITQDHDRGDTLNTSPLAIDSTNFFVKSIGIGAELENFKDIKPKFVSLGNSPQELTKVKSVVVDLSSLIFSSSSWFFEDLSFIANGSYTLYVCEDEIHDFFAKSSKASLAEKLGNRGHLYSMPDLANRNDKLLIQKVKTMAHIAVLTFNNSRAGEFYCMNDISGHSILPFKLDDGVISSDFACPWSNDIKTLSNKVLSEISNSVDNFEKYAEISSKEKQEAEESKKDSIDSVSLSSTTTDDSGTLDLTLELNDLGNVKDSIKEAVSQNSQIENTVAQNIKTEKSRDTLGISIETEAESVLVDIENDDVVIDPGLAAEKIAVTGGNSNLSDSTVDINSLSVEDESFKDFLNSPKLSDFESTSTTTEKKSHKISLFGAKDEPATATPEVKEEQKPLVSEVKVEPKTENKVDSVVETSPVKADASPVIDVVKQTTEVVETIVAEPIVAETISVDPKPITIQATTKSEPAPVEAITPAQVATKAEVIAPVETVKVVENVTENMVEKIEPVVAETPKVEPVQSAQVEVPKAEPVQPVVADTTKQEEEKVAEPAPIALSSDESQDDVQKNEDSQKKGDESKNNNVLANILAKNKQAIEHRAKAAEERANRKPGYLTSSSTGFSLTKKQLKDIEERHRKEALEDKKYEEQIKRQNGELVDTPTTETSSTEASVSQSVAKENTSSLDSLSVKTSSSSAESKNTNESSIGIVESVDIVAAESVSLDIFNDVTSDVIEPSSKSQDNDLSGLVVESTTSHNAVNSSEASQASKGSTTNDSDASKKEGTETAETSTTEESKNEKPKHEPKNFKLQSNSAGGFTLTKEQLEAKAKKKAEEEAKRKEEEEKAAKPREPKNFKLSGGNAAGFHLTAEQMEKIRKKREEEEKVRQLQKDVEALEKEAAQEAAQKATEEQQNQEVTNEVTNEPKEVKFASQGAGFGLSLEKQKEYDQRHRINKQAELEAKKAEYERHKKELEELNREVALIKAIEEYELNGEEGDFVFDPEKDVSVSEIVEIDDFEMTQERRDLLRKYEVQNRPDIDVKRNLSGTSAHSAEDSRMRGVGALSTHSSNRKTSSVLGFNPTSFSDTPKFEHNVQTNIERPTIDYSVINKVIEEREKAYAENPTVREDVKTTRVHTSETIDIVVRSDNGQKVDVDYKTLNSTDNFAPSISVEKISTPFSYTGEAFKANRDFGFVKNPNLGDTVYIDGEPVVLKDVVFLTPCWKVFSYGDSKVIRIFGPDVLNANLVAKLVAMQSNVIQLTGIDWPEKLVKNEEGDIVGCVTIKNKHKSMAQICGNVEYYLSTKTRVDVIDIAISYLKQVQRLNDCHVYLGFEDLNSVCIDEHNEVSFCYLERMQVGNYLYVPAPGAIVAPECYEEENICADELSDRFIVADTIFRMMFAGKGPFVFGRHQGVSLDKVCCFRFPINAFDEMVAPKDSSLYIWSFLPNYIKEAFISSLYLGYHKAEERKTCKEWLDLLRRWRTEIQNQTLPPMANEIIPSRMYVGDKDLVDQCKICRGPVEKSSAILTEGLCHHCFNQRGKLVKCACCGNDFMLSYRDTMLNINTKQICEDCKMKDIQVKSIHKCKKCGSSYPLTETYERMFKEQSKELCPSCVKTMDITK